MDSAEVSDDVLGNLDRLVVWVLDGLDQASKVRLSLVSGLSVPICRERGLCPLWAVPQANTAPSLDGTVPCRRGATWACRGPSVASQDAVLLSPRAPLGR